MGKDENTNAGSSSRAYQPERRRLLKKIRLRNLVINLFFFSVVGTGLVWTCGHFWKYLRYDITNDAFIDQYVSPVNIRVPRAPVCTQGRHAPDSGQQRVLYPCEGGGGGPA